MGGHVNRKMDKWTMASGEWSSYSRNGHGMEKCSIKPIIYWGKEVSSKSLCLSGGVGDVIVVVW